MAIAVDQNYDKAQRKISTANLEQFAGVDCQLLVEKETHRPIIMDGATVGGKFKCASTDELKAVETVANNAVSKAYADDTYLSKTSAETSYVSKQFAEETYTKSSEAVKTVAQTLTDEQKATARNNIGANFTALNAYPVGSIYLSVLDLNPSNLFGGIWEKIQNAFLYGSGSKSLGSTGGSETVTLATSQLPRHTHSRGTMDITGQFEIENSRPVNMSGAFSGVGSNVGYNGGYNANTVPKTVKLTASSGWNGSTSSVGSGEAHNNMPPYLVVNIWKRTA